MEKHLVAKVQKLTKKLPQESLAFSSVITIEPEDQLQKEKHGTLHAVFDVSGQSPLDPLLVTKVVKDVLHDSYYGSDVSSPMQSIEKAILQVRDRIIHLSKDLSKSSEDLLLDFNTLVSVLWGNVLYLVQYGKGASYLIRAGEIKPVNFATEGNFSVASGIVKQDDVVILGTQDFVSSYKPEDLLGGKVSPSQSSLSDKSSAVLMKFDLAAVFTEDEKIDFVGVSSKSNKVEAEVAVPMKQEKKEDVGIRDEKVITPSRVPRRRRGSNPIVEFFKNLHPLEFLKNTLGKIKPTTKEPKVAVTLKMDKGSGRGKSKLRLIVTVLIAVLLVGSIVMTIKGWSFSDVKIGKENVEEKIADEEGTEEEVVEEEIKYFGETNLVEAITPETFYDIKFADENANPTGMVVLDNSVLVTDQNSGKIFQSSLTVPKFVELEDQFSGIKSLSYFGGDVGFADSEGFKVYDAVKEVVTESYVGEGLDVSTTYLAFVYSVEGDKIVKYTKDDPLEGTTWAQNSVLNGAVSVAVDGSIYVLKSNGELLEFFQGEDQGLEIAGLENGFSNPVQVVTDYGMDFIYVADAGNKRVVVLNKEGELEKQVFAENMDDWSDIRAIGVNVNEDVLFVLNGSKVYEIEL